MNTEQLIPVLDLISERLDKVTKTDESAQKSTKISFYEPRKSYDDEQLVENPERSRQIKDIIDISNSSGLISLY